MWKFVSKAWGLLLLATYVNGLRPHEKRFLNDLQKRTILQNGQVRITDYPDTQIDPSAYRFTTYPPDASEISYKGRWDANHVSWWSAPGLKFGFTGETVAITFGDLTSDGVLVGYRLSGLDWTFTNITAGATHLLVSSATITTTTDGANLTRPVSPPNTLELRVTNWAYGVQIDAVHVAEGASLVRVVAPEERRRTVEFIGDSLTSGMYTTYEGLTSFGYGIGAGLGDAEYGVTAYPGICAADRDCWGNPRGQARQWFYTCDTSYRAQVLYGANLENAAPWNFSAHPAADLVIINIGTNDQNAANNVSADAYQDALIKLIEGVHGVWPGAQVMIMSLWIGFYQNGNSYTSDASQGLVQQIQNTYDYFNSDAYLHHPTVYDGVTDTTRTLNTTSSPFVKIFNTTGILQHNDIGPQYHPTDVGAVKVASHALQYINLIYGWDLRSDGSEIQHDTLYWNDEESY